MIKLTDERFTYAFGMFFDDGDLLTDNSVLNILNAFDNRVKLQEEYFERAAQYFGFKSARELIKKVERKPKNDIG